MADKGSLGSLTDSDGIFLSAVVVLVEDGFEVTGEDSIGSLSTGRFDERVKIRICNKDRMPHRRCAISSKKVRMEMKSVYRPMG